MRSGNYVYHPVRDHIVLEDLNAILPQYLRVTVKPNAQDWDVRSIEIYPTRADADACTHCLADDIQITELPGSSRLSLYGALSAYAHEQRERIHAISVAAMGVGVRA